MSQDRDEPATGATADLAEGAARLWPDSLPDAYVAAVLDKAGIPTGPPPG